MGGSDECTASSSLAEVKGGGFKRCNWREGGRGGGPLMPPILGLGGSGGGERGREVRVILATGGTGVLSIGSGGGGEKSGGSI